MIIEYPRYPTPEEIHALEHAARRARAETIARLFGAAVRGLVKLIVRGAALLAGKSRGPRAPARRAV